MLGENMGIIENLINDFDNGIFKRTGKHYYQLNNAQKIKALNEAEIMGEQIATRLRAMLRKLKREL